ncbi:transmembrane protein 53 isoform X1 [Scleropages formosus]|nr:transmembrane protein 53 isoform X1 [Scleropages formosus]
MGRWVHHIALSVALPVKFFGKNSLPFPSDCFTGSVPHPFCPLHSTLESVLIYGNMGDVCLDYNVVFPQSSISEKHWKGSQGPVVILLGWAGCKDRHLVKYSSIYNEQGCITFRYTAPLRSVFISESLGYRELRTTANKLLELLYEYEVENNPIFFHVFSNGGFMLYRYMVELLRSDAQFRTLRVVGAVMDSGPGNRNLKGALRAIVASLGPKSNAALVYILLVLFACMVVLLRIILYPLTRYIHKNHYDAMREHPATWPQLYLYSRADNIIQHEDVEQMVKAVQEKGISVESFAFDTSAHVCLFRDFPEEYPRRCLAFLGNCMREETRPKKRLSVPS